jgi:tetratricopeptide (TPR) repeat protein
MKALRRLSLLALLGTAGCFPDHPPAPEELALERYEDAEAHYAAGRVADAAVDYEFAAANRPRWKEAYLKLGRCRELQHREDDAIVVYERLLIQYRNDEDGLRAVAKLYAQRGEPDKALDRYRRLKTVNPQDRSLDGEIARLEALKKS